MRSEDDIMQAMNAHGDAVWRICLLRMGSRSDAQDAFQETFLSYATHDATVLNDEEHRRAWLLRTATNQCIDMLRMRKPEEPFDERFELAPTLELSEQPDAALWEVTEALNRLSPDQREAIYLTTCEGYPATEAAHMMSVPVNTLYSWIARGKEHLRKALS